MYRVLVADDEVHICQLIRHLVDWEALDAQLCGVANDGVEAFELIRSQHPHIVISDIRMSGMDGISLLEQVRNAGIRCAFILVSGYREFDYAQQAIHLGVTDYLVKPINKLALNRAIRKGITELQNEHTLEKLTAEHSSGSTVQRGLESLKSVVEARTSLLDTSSLTDIAQQQGLTLPPQIHLYY